MQTNPNRLQQNPGGLEPAVRVGGAQMCRYFRVDRGKRCLAPAFGGADYCDYHAGKKALP